MLYGWGLYLRCRPRYTAGPCQRATSPSSSSSSPWPFSCSRRPEARRRRQAAQEAPATLTLPAPAGSPEQPEDAGDERTIAGLRARAYESGPIEIVRTLATTPQYTSYLIAYPSDGLRVTGYLNVPHGEGPFPVLLVNHGYVPPAGYVAVASNYTKREGDFFAARGTSPPEATTGGTATTPATRRGPTWRAPTSLTP